MNYLFREPKVLLKNIYVKKNFYVILSSLIVFLFYFVIVQNLNIHGDAKFQSLNAVESAKEGYLVDHQSYRVFNFDNNKILYEPIAYPLTFESLFTILYLFGGETFFKLYSPICASLIYLISYLCLKELGFFKSLFISLIAVFSISERLIMTPLIEPFMIVSLLMGIYLLKKFFKTNELSYLFVGIIFLGSAAAIKQQGLIDACGILAFVFFYILYIFVKKQKKLKKTILIFLICFILFISLPFLALKNQIDRTGTLAFSPGGTKIPSIVPLANDIQPFFFSKYKDDPKSVQAINETVGYNKLKFTYFDKLRSFLISPIIFYNSNTSLLFDDFSINTSGFLLVLIILCLLNWKNVFIENRLFIFFLAVVFLIEITISFIFNTPVTQYHSFGLIITIFLILTSIFSLNASKKIRLSLLAYFMSLFIIGYSEYIVPLWFSSGRENNYQIEGYKRMGQFINRNIPTDAIFFAGETSFRYYAQRNTVWLNESIGDKVRKILITQNKQIAIYNLKALHIDYIVIDKAQTQRPGVGDYMPPNGLLTLINKSKYITKIYDPYGDGDLSLYKINYE